MGIKAKILIPTIVLTLLVTATILVTDIVRFSGFVEETTAERLRSASEIAFHHLTYLETRATAASLSVAQDRSVIAAIISGERNRLEASAEEATVKSGADFCTIVDPEGLVLLRVHDPENYGDSLTSLATVRAALAGESMTAIEEGRVISLSIRAVTPVYDNMDNLVGAVTVGYRLDTNQYVDEVKKMSGCETTVFLGGKRVSTTILKDDGTRASGTTAELHISETVLAGETYTGRADILGRTAISSYAPIIGPAGQVVGMLFVGQYVDVVEQTIDVFIKNGLPVTFLLLTIFVLLMLLITGRIVTPIRAMTRAADALAAGETDIDVPVKTRRNTKKNTTVDTTGDDRGDTAGDTRGDTTEDSRGDATGDAQGNTKGNTLAFSRDEIQTLAAAFGRMILNTRRQVETVRHIADGSLSVSPVVRSEKDIMNRALADLNDTLRAQAAAISEEHERLRIMLDATPLSIRLWTRNYEMVECNEASVRLFRLKDKQEYKERFLDFSPEYQPDGLFSRDKIRILIKKAFEIGECTYEWMYRLPDGTPLPAEVTLVRVPYGGDYVVAGYSRDLREQEEMLSEIARRDQLLNVSYQASFQLFAAGSKETEITLKIEESLALLGEGVDADQVYLAQNETVNGFLYFTCQYTWVKEPAAGRANILPGMRFPYARDAEWKERFGRGQCMNAPVRELPRSVREFFAPFAVKSALVIPIFVEERFWGLIGFSDCRKDRYCGEDEMSILRTMGLMMAVALNRSFRAVGEDGERQSGMVGRKVRLSRVRRLRGELAEARGEERDSELKRAEQMPVGMRGEERRSELKGAGQMPVGIRGEGRFSELKGTELMPAGISEGELYPAKGLEQAPVGRCEEEQKQLTEQQGKWSQEAKERPGGTFSDLEGQMERLEEPLPGVEGSAEGSEEQRAQTENQRESAEDLAKRLDEPRKRLDEPGKRLDEPEKRLDEPGKRLDEPGKRLDEPEKRLDEPGKRLDEPGKRLDEPGKRLDEPAKRLDESGKRLEESERQPAEPEEYPQARKSRPNEIPPIHSQENDAGTGGIGTAGTFFKDIIINGMDKEQALERFGGEATLIEVLRSYAASTRFLLPALREYLNEGEVVDYTIALRGIKGSSYSIFAGETGRAAEALELAVKDGDEAAVERCQTAFEAAADGLLTEIERVLWAIDSGRGKAPDTSGFTAPDAAILIVEDNETSLKAALGLLRPLKMRMDTAENGKAALKKIQGNRYDLILMDHMMPEMDGIEATGHLREMDGDYYRNVPVIALTASEAAGTRESCLQAGMNDLVRKPVERKELHAAVRKFLPEGLVRPVVPPEGLAVGLASRQQRLGRAAEVLPGSAGLMESEGLSGNTGLTKRGDSSGNAGLMGNADSPEDTGLTESAGWPENADLTGSADSPGNADFEDYAELRENTDLPEIAGIDSQAGIRYSGTKELFVSLLGDFYRLIDMKATKIEKCLADGLLRDVTIEVHALKSTARMIGAGVLAERFYRLEQYGNEGNQEALERETPAVLELYRSYKPVLKPFGEVAEQEKRAASAAEVVALLKEIKAAMDGFELDRADEAMGQLEKLRLPEGNRERMERLRAYMADVSIEDVLEVVEEMMGGIEEGVEDELN